MPDDSELQHFKDEMANGARDEDLIAEIMGSDEYFNNRAGGTDDGFVDAVYTDLLNHRVDRSSRDQLVQGIQNGLTRLQVARQVMDGLDYRDALVTSDDKQLLIRTPTSSELGNGVQFLIGNGKNVDLQAQIAGTNDYFNNRAGGTNESFVTSVYHDLVGGLVDDTAKAKWVQELQTNVSRSQVIMEITATDEYRAALVKTYFRRFLTCPSQSGILAAPHRTSGFLGGIFNLPGLLLVGAVGLLAIGGGLWFMTQRRTTVAGFASMPMRNSSRVGPSLGPGRSGTIPPWRPQSPPAQPTQLPPWPPRGDDSGT